MPSNSNDTVEVQTEHLLEQVKKTLPYANEHLKTPTDRVVALSKAIQLSASYLSESATAATATLSLAAAHLPGEPRIESYQEGDTRTFTLFVGERRVGTVMLDVCSKASGHVGAGVRVMINEDIVAYGMPGNAEKPSVEN